MTTRVLFVGDTHGDLDFLSAVFQRASDLRVDVLFQVGDFGFLWPGSDQTPTVERLSRNYAIPLYWIDGNHDWHPEIRRRYADRDLTWEISGVHHLRRGRVLTIPGDGASGMRICGLGGAPSIDRAHRTLGSSWWEEEEITDEDVARVPYGLLDPIDVLATHDAPAMPPGFGQLRDAAQNARGARSHELVSEALRRTHAPVLVHGHWHRSYYDVVPSTDTEVFGLDCNDATKFEHAILLVEKSDAGELSVSDLQPPTTRPPVAS